MSDMTIAPTGQFRVVEIDIRNATMSATGDPSDYVDVIGDYPSFDAACEVAKECTGGRYQRQIHNDKGEDIPCKIT